MSYLISFVKKKVTSDPEKLYILCSLGMATTNIGGAHHLNIVDICS